MFFRPNNVGEGIRAGIASRLVWEKNVKVAVWGSPIMLSLSGNSATITHKIYCPLLESNEIRDV